MTIKSNEVTVTFKSGPHRSGRGFLLSYATDRYPGMMSITVLIIICEVYECSLLRTSAVLWHVEHIAHIVQMSAFVA